MDLTKGRAEGLYRQSMELLFYPGPKIIGGQFKWSIGTAGSTSLMAQCLLFPSLFAEEASTYTINGGLFQDFAPNSFHMKYVLLEILKKMSVQANLMVLKPGYVPSGDGEIKIEIEPLTSPLKSLRLLNQGRITSVRGIAISSHLKENKVSERMALACAQELQRIRGIDTDIEIIYDEKSEQKGAALFIYASTDTGCIIGSDMAGSPGRSSEKIGRLTAQRLSEDIESGATVDRFTADQLILYAALAEGESTYYLPRMTDHIESNLWLIQNILGAHVRLDGLKLSIRGVGLAP